MYATPFFTVLAVFFITIKITYLAVLTTMQTCNLQPFPVQSTFALEHSSVSKIPHLHMQNTHLHLADTCFITSALDQLEQVASSANICSPDVLSRTAMISLTSGKLILPPPLSLHQLDSWRQFMSKSSSCKAVEHYIT